VTNKLITLRNLVLVAITVAISIVLISLCVNSLSTQNNTVAASQLAKFKSLSVAANGKVEVIAKLADRPGNLAVTPDGRIIMSLHPFGSSKYKVVELFPDGTTEPFPNAQWSQSPDKNGVGFNAVIGLESDRNGVVWMLDKGGAKDSVPKLVAWDTQKNKLVQVIQIPEPAFQPNSFMQDLAVDLDHQAVYIADMSRGDLVGVSNPAIVVVDIKTGVSRRALIDHLSLQPEQGANFLIDSKALMVSDGKGGLVQPELGLNPITIDAQNEWVYYGAMNSRSLYRVRTKDLLDTNFSPAKIGTKVERYGDKAVSDGISIDGAGNVYITDVNANAIGVTTPDGNYRVLYQDNAVLSWADGMSYGADGHFYVTVNQLHRNPALNGGKDASKPPYLIVRFKPIASGSVGR
jgi:sugar lactone lactonase YvrE